MDSREKAKDSASYCDVLPEHLVDRIGNRVTQCHEPRFVHTGSDPVSGEIRFVEKSAVFHEAPPEAAEPALLSRSVNSQRRIMWRTRKTTFTFT